MSASVVCTNCGHHGPPRAESKGNLWLGIVLLLLFILPGVLYMIWGMQETNVCALCGDPRVVPDYTPEGQRLLAQTHSR